MIEYWLAKITCFLRGHKYQKPFFGCVICERCGDWYNVESDDE